MQIIRHHEEDRLTRNKLSSSIPHSITSRDDRDERIDFFRGVAWCIIFIAHIPNNWLANYMPGKFGLSDSAELFIFLSGYVAAKSFTRTFAQAGFLIGTVRVLERCWVLYIAHLLTFFALAAICAAGNRLGGVDYIERLNLYYFFNSTPDAIIGIFTLTYVPNYFDILPTYIVIMLLIPPIMLLASYHIWYVPVACFSIYLTVWWFGLELPAEIISDRPWFFNPLAWQLMFFTGFMLGAKWIIFPNRSKIIFIASLFFIFYTIPISHYFFYNFLWTNEIVSDIHAMLELYMIKTNLGILRWLHFLTLAYVVTYLLHRDATLLQYHFARKFILMGQQGLPIFALGMLLSYIAGMSLDYLDYASLSVLLINFLGIVIMLYTAYFLRWLKTRPWKSSVTALASP